MPFINEPDSSSDLSILIILFISSFEIFIALILVPNTFLWIATSVDDAAVVNPNGIETLLADGLNKFYIKNNPDFSNGPKSLPENPPDFPILCSFW